MTLTLPEISWRTDEHRPCGSCRSTHTATASWRCDAHDRPHHAIACGSCRRLTVPASQTSGELSATPGVCLIDPFLLQTAAADVLSLRDDAPATDDLDDFECDLSRLRGYYTQRLRDARALRELH